MTAMAPVPVLTVPQCQFGFCRRDSEHMVIVESERRDRVDVQFACVIHVTPLTVWGRSEPLEQLAIRPI